MRRLGKRAVSANFRYPACLFNTLVSEKEEGEGEEEDGVLMVGCVSGNLEINIELERDSIGILKSEDSDKHRGFFAGFASQRMEACIYVYIYIHTYTSYTYPRAVPDFILVSHIYYIKINNKLKKYLHENIFNFLFYNNIKYFFTQITELLTFYKQNNHLPTTTTRLIMFKSN